MTSAARLTRITARRSAELAGSGEVVAPLEGGGCPGRSFSSCELRSRGQESGRAEDIAAPVRRGHASPEECSRENNANSRLRSTRDAKLRGSAEVPGSKRLKFAVGNFARSEAASSLENFSVRWRRRRDRGVGCEREEPARAAGNWGHCRSGSSGWQFFQLGCDGKVGRDVGGLWRQKGAGIRRPLGVWKRARDLPPRPSCRKARASSEAGVITLPARVEGEARPSGG